MTEQEFCYWLQGYFELSGANQLNDQQIKCIGAHLQMVKTLNKNFSEFTGWLSSLLIAQQEGMKFSAEVILKIKKKLNEKFKHEIDGSYNVPQSTVDELNYLHGDILLRC